MACDIVLKQSYLWLNSIMDHDIQLLIVIFSLLIFIYILFWNSERIYLKISSLLKYLCKKKQDRNLSILPEPQSGNELL